jgi:hypothetical protein
VPSPAAVIEFNIGGEHPIAPAPSPPLSLRLESASQVVVLTLEKLYSDIIENE